MKSEEKNQIEEEIRLLEISFELSRSNYHLWSSFYLAAVAIIFMIAQIMIDIFTDNKISVFGGAVLAYLIFSFIFGYKLFYEMYNSNVKYESLIRRFEKLNVNVKEINKELKKRRSKLTYFRWIVNFFRAK